MLTRGEIERVDKFGMYESIHSAPEQLIDSYLSARDLISAVEFPEVRRLVFVGMGASATAAELLLPWMERETDVPVEIIRSYKLPKLGDGAFLVVVSKSGETIETIKAFEQALGEYPMICVVCGGSLERMSSHHGIPCVKVKATPLSRTTTFSLVGGILAVVERLLNLGNLETSVREGLTTLEAVRDLLSVDVDLERNEAKLIALRLNDKRLHVLATWDMRPVGLRLVQQLNENAKSGAYLCPLPDAVHNFIMQRRGKEDGLIVIRKREEDKLEEEALKAFIDATRDNGSDVEKIEGEGGDLLSALLTATLKVDFFSYYLSILLGVDPTPTPHIDRARRRMKSVA